jgi:cytochrome c
MKSALFAALVAAVLFATFGGCREAGPAGTRYAAEPVGRGTALDECVVCHSVEKNGPFRSAPPLWGIVGAPKARTRWYGYSPALARKGGVWTREELDQYLADPDGFLPGTRKTLIGIPDPAKRASDG